MNKIIFLFCCLCVLLASSHLEATFNNTGRFLSDNVALNVGGTLDNNGEIIGRTSLALSCDVLTGKGLIQSPKVVIKAKHFAYTGKISCTESCTIIVSEPFNESMFTKHGKGKLEIIVDNGDSKKNMFRKCLPAPTLEFTAE